MNLSTASNRILGIPNRKGGVGKTTTTVNLAQGIAVRLPQTKILVIDADPSGNATTACGISLDSVEYSLADLIRDRALSAESAIYRGESVDLIPATPTLANLEREMVSMTNSELRLAQRVKTLALTYPVILIDAPPSFGPLMNSVLNASTHVLIPVGGFFSLHGIKSLLGEIDEIKITNPGLEILGYLLTFTDRTNLREEIRRSLKEDFADKLFETQIRRTIKLEEAPALGKTIFHHAPDSIGAEDYLKLADEVLCRLGISPAEQNSALEGGVR